MFCESRVDDATIKPVDRHFQKDIWQFTVESRAFEYLGTELANVSDELRSFRASTIAKIPGGL